MCNKIVPYPFHIVPLHLDNFSGGLRGLDNSRQMKYQFILYSLVALNSVLPEQISLRMRDERNNLLITFMNTHNSNTMKLRLPTCIERKLYGFGSPLHLTGGGGDGGDFLSTSPGEIVIPTDFPTLQVQIRIDGILPIG